MSKPRDVNLSKKNAGTIIGTQILAGIEVRIVEHQGKLYIPEIDVGRGLDQSRGSFRNLMERNKELLENYSHDFIVTSGGVAPQKMKCLSFEGVRAAIFIVDHNVKDPVRRTFLLERKREYLRIINDYYQKKTIPSGSIEDWIKERKKAATNWNRLRDALKVKIVPHIRDSSHERFVYINEAKMLNKNVYGYHQKGLRDRSTLNQISALENAEAWDTAFLHLNILDKNHRDALIDDMLIRHYPELEHESVLPEPAPTLKISVPPGQRVLIEFLPGLGESA